MKRREEGGRRLVLLALLSHAASQLISNRNTDGATNAKIPIAFVSRERASERWHNRDGWERCLLLIARRASETTAITKGISLCRKTIRSTFPSMTSNSVERERERAGPVEIGSDTPIIREMQLRGSLGGDRCTQTLGARRLCGSARSAGCTRSPSSSLSLSLSLSGAAFPRVRFAYST